jgi:hypothetical protein
VPKFKGIVVVKIGHTVEGEFDSVEEFKQAVAIKFSKGYDSTVTDDNNVSWNNGHEFVEYDSIKEGSIESYVVSAVE